MELLVLIALSCSQVDDLIATVEDTNQVTWREKQNLINKLQVHCPPWLPDKVAPDHSLKTYHERIECTKIRL